MSAVRARIGVNVHHGQPVGLVGGSRERGHVRELLGRGGGGVAGGAVEGRIGVMTDVLVVVRGVVVVV
jgi:hypothetical protein